MNPRIYKKQAKRAVELLRSHGQHVDEYEPDPDMGVGDPPGGWRRMQRQPKHVRRAWDCIAGVPIRIYNCGGWEPEWDARDARNDWMLVHGYDGMQFDKHGDLLPPPRINHKRRRDWISTKAIAPGWRWRGGRAVRVAT
ncbi:hypothetical protein GTP38_11040 [Duganella sp. FT94W]|uniref:Uncharacterized protein n=1 Tax=Duganella lactea TaxID=2692173 RepID=A0ABW9V5A4_9BURK|nr:hypothetical protein [Duganella lactea]MYM34874.1 hypothetical protein [Duganella lactea]